MPGRPSRSIKMVLVGDINVGKTSLTKVFVEDNFREKYSPTVGGRFMAKTLETPRAILQIWDTAGTERFRSMLPSFMRGAECVVIVYDISNRQSFLSVQDYWIDYIKASGPEIVAKVLVANKSDSQLRAVEHNEGRQLADCYNMLFFETSAKYMSNVHKMFTDAAKEVLKTVRRPTTQHSHSFKLEELGDKKRKCCQFS